MYALREGAVLPKEVPIARNSVRFRLVLRRQLASKVKERQPYEVRR